MLKYTRTKKISAIGACDASFNAMYDNIPDAIKASLPSNLLAKLVDANWALASASKALVTRDIILNGYLWDSQSNKSIDLVG